MLSFIAKALGAAARAHGMSQLARDTGLIREGLYKSFFPEGKLGFETVVRVLHAFGLRLCVRTLADETPVESSEEGTAVEQAG